MTAEERADKLVDSRAWERMTCVIGDDGGSFPEYGVDEDKLRSLVASAIREAEEETRQSERFSMEVGLGYASKESVMRVVAAVRAEEREACLAAVREVLALSRADNESAEAEAIRDRLDKLLRGREEIGRVVSAGVYEAEDREREACAALLAEAAAEDRRCADGARKPYGFVPELLDRYAAAIRARTNTS